MVASALVVAACGGDDSSTTDTATPNTTVPDSAPSDTTADDRDRNVQMDGWGVDGAGFTETVVNSRARTRTETRVFRRSRTEVVERRKLLNTRDVFVVSVVNRASSGSSETFFKVAGYDTTGDDPSLYTMQGFGDKGVVTVRVPARTNGWATFPSGWTVISRDILVAYFDNWSDTPEDRGVIEYYDLRTGGLLTTLGTEGRTVLSREFPISWVKDIGLKAVDDDGTIHLLLAGLANFGAEDEAVMVAGITPDGRFDPKIGANGSGTINYADVMAPASTRQVWRVRIADPGIEGTADALGLVVVAEAVTTESKDRPGEDSVTYIVSKAATAGAPITHEGGSSFALTQAMGQSNVDVRNIALAPNGGIGVHMSGSEVGKYWWDGTATNRFVVTTRSGIQEKPANGVNWAGVGPNIFRVSPLLLDVSTDGRKFAVEGFNNQLERRYEARVCFAPPNCLQEGSFDVIALAEIAPLEGSSPIPESITVGASGIHVAIENADYDIDSHLYTVANFEPTGNRAGSLSAVLDATFRSQTFETVTTSSGTEQVVVGTVSGPIALDADRVVAVRSSRAGLSLVLQKRGKDPREVKLSIPLGVVGYSTTPSQFAAIDANHVSMVATIDDGVSRVQRIYKVNVENGSVDTSFGEGGFVEVPENAPMETCLSVNRVVSAAGALASVTLDWPVSDDDAPDCARAPSKVRWATFGPSGEQIGTSESVADVSKIDGWIDGTHTIDARGNLFYAKYYREFDDTGEYVGHGVRIAKFGLSGQLDASFGTAGVLELPDHTAVRTGTDAEGRLYVTNLVREEILRVSRYSTTGVLDAVVMVTPTTNEAPSTTVAPDTSPRKQQESVEKRREFESTSMREVEKAKEGAQPAVALPNDGLTVTTEKPVLSSVMAEEDRSLTVSWVLSAAVGNVFVTATASPGGRACTSDTRRCIIRGLDPTETYTITLAKKDEEPQAATVAMPTKPVVSLRAGRVASPTVFIRPASKGKATWKVRGGCKLNETNTRVTAPKSPTTCQLTVTTEKFGSTPKTTKSVTIVVKK